MVKKNNILKRGDKIWETPKKNLLSGKIESIFCGFHGVLRDIPSPSKMDG